MLIFAFCQILKGDTTLSTQSSVDHYNAKCTLPLLPLFFLVYYEQYHVYSYTFTLLNFPKLHRLIKTNDHLITQLLHRLIGVKFFLFDYSFFMFTGHGSLNLQNSLPSIYMLPCTASGCWVGTAWEKNIGDWDCYPVDLEKL